MFKLSLNQVTTYRWSLEDDVAAAVAYGYGGLGLWRAKVSDFGVEATADAMLEHGLAATSLSWVGGFTGSEGATFRETLCDGFETVQMASELRCPLVLAVSGGRNNHTRRHSRNLFMSAMRELAEAAAAVNVSLAIEPMHAGCSHEGTFIHSLAEAADVISELGASNVGIALDTYHVGHDPQLFDWLPVIAPLVRLVQLGDGRKPPLGEANRCLWGHGRVPLTRIISELFEAGYDGPLEVELLGEDLTELGYAEVLEESRRYGQRLQRIVSRSRAIDPQP
jgi:sugar phosphate isomerase/epimerase